MPYILNAKARLKLKHKLHDMCINLCNHLRENHILVQKGVKEKENKRGKVVGIKPIWDLPVCACYCSAHCINAEGYSHRMLKCHQLLEKELLKYGNVGKAPSKGVLAINHDPWPLGQCAEQHAANRLLYEANEKPTPKGKGRNPGTQFNAIYVGPAYRVKTRQFMPPCKNCKAIFNSATIL